MPKKTLNKKNQKVEVVNSVLKKIGADKVPKLQVLNKIDLLENENDLFKNDIEKREKRINLLKTKIPLK